MEYQYNIAGHLCRIVFCDAGNDSSLLPSFSPFKSEEEGNLLFCLSVDDAFRWPVTGEEVGQFDCGGNNFGVYRLPDGSYQFEICDEKKALCCLCTVAAMSGKHDSERERIGKFCLALAVRIDHEMGSPYSFSALRHHFGHHPPFADIPFRMQAG